MYLVMGITGNVAGATARHLLKQGKQVRALVRNPEKAAKWADQGVGLVHGDWQRHRGSVLTHHVVTPVEPSAKLLRKPVVRLDTGQTSYAGMQQIKKAATSPLAAITCPI
jgi:nucleoside-diphosphate-sugar epimerase